MKLERCAECNRPLASELVKQALARRGGPSVVQMLAGRQLCPHCKREQLAKELAAVVPGDGAGKLASEP